jgi:hypothetical protein
MSVSGVARNIYRGVGGGGVYASIFFGGGIQQSQLRTEGYGGGSPLVRGSTQFAKE